MKSKILTSILVGTIILLLVGMAYVLRKQRRTVITPTKVVELPTTTVETEEMLREYIKDNDSLTASLIKANDRLKSYTSIRTEFRVDTLRIPIKADTVYQTKWREKEKIVERIVYQGFEYHDQTLAFKGKVTPTELSIDSLTVKSRITLVQLERKPRGFFKKIFGKRKATVIALSDDPRVSLTGKTSIEVKPPSDNYWKGFRDGTITGAAVGIGGTIAIKK